MSPPPAAHAIVVAQRHFSLRRLLFHHDDVLPTCGALAAAAAAASYLLLFASKSENKRTDDAVRIHPLLLHPTFSYEANELSSYTTKFASKNYITTSLQFTSCESMNNKGHTTYNQQNPLNPNSIIIECDYAILGHGKAGQSAAETLHKLVPDADIVTIDPNNKIYEQEHKNDNDIDANRNRRGTKKKRGSTNHLKTYATFIDHSNKLIRLHSNPFLPTDMNDSSSSSTSNIIVHFRKSALIATGSRGAPPPRECIHDGAWNRILELRSTSLPPASPALTQQCNDNINYHHHRQQQQQQQQVSIPVLDPSSVRSLSLLAASEGATVTIMGSGFEALELAASLSRMQLRQQQTSKDNANNGDDNNNNNNKRVILLFGNAGPLSTRLPRYLSAAVSKRLRQCGIEVEERSLARYLSVESSAAAVAPRLELYTVKSYDNLDSRRISTDLLVLAPNVEGYNGTSVVPALNAPVHEYNHHQQQYLPWSSLAFPPVLTCYLDDGKVATNSEFQAASNLYAAGSVTRSPSLSGRADVAGGLCSSHVGEIAARNMIRSDSNRSDRSKSSNYGYCADVDASIPVWRSDVIPLNPMRNESTTLALYSMGIHALCVGRCDSETLATHGLWWTNTSHHQLHDDDCKSNSSSNTHSVRRIITEGPNVIMRRITSGTKGLGSGLLPVYGSGVVYYLDRSGNICGIMLWGLPFSQHPQGVKSKINHLVVERMKEMIRSNGRVAIQDHSNKIVEKDHAGLNVDLNVLSYLHLVEESKLLASMALSGSTPKENVKIDVVGKPLHRYTPIKSPLSSLGKLKRKEMGLAQEDDLFYPKVTRSTSIDEELTRPPSLRRIYPMHGGVTATYAEREIELRQLEIDRSRPSKEEPLWIRQGEEHRFVNKRESVADTFYRNIQKGRFSDGTDAVKQAPVPQFAEQLKSWTTSSS